jgi:CPA2 family monovalent cation:H+ antiporter-2
MTQSSWTFAAGELPEFMLPLTVIVVAGAVVAWLCQRLGIVPIVGFLVAGVVIGPNALGVVERQETVTAAAELGVILLLFTIGVEFSLDRLARVKRLVLGGGAASVTFVVVVTAGIAIAFGVSAKPAIYTGLLVSVSSTAVVLSILASRRETSTASGQLSVAVLVFEDVAVVGMVLLVPMLGTSGGSIGELVRSLGVAASVIAVVLVVARRVMPRVLESVARLCSPEVFLIAVVAICVATAYLTGLAGVSVSLGAFLAGLVVSESRHSTHVLSEVLPLEIIFTAVFFLSVGMLLDPAFLVEHAPVVIGAVVAVFVIKGLAGTIGARLVGVALPIALGSALLRAQIGEFSFVLELAGRSEGLTPLDFGSDGSQLFIATTVVLMVATPGLGALGRRIERDLGAREGRRRAASALGLRDGTAAFDALAATGATGAADPAHVLVLGYGLAARGIIGELRGLGVEHTVVTLSPDGAAEAEADGVQVVVGDYGKQAVLTHVGVERASAVVIGDDDPERTFRVTLAVRELNPTATIIVRPTGDADVAELAAAGADHVVTPERASQIGLGIAVRDALAPHVGPVPLSTVVRFDPDPASPCPHLDEIVPVQPSAYGCEDCLRIGSTWVHLRICLSCGHVGCCDSSPHRHARAHSEAVGHPIMASFEPGEHWAHCFFDETDISPRTGAPSAHEVAGELGLRPIADADADADPATVGGEAGGDGGTPHDRAGAGDLDEGGLDAGADADAG